MEIPRSAAVYFGAVFGAGFALGAVRVPLLVPRLGERAAELIELPIMMLVVALVARWRQRRTPALRPGQQLAVGALALAMLLAAEFALGAALAGKTPRAVLLDRDPVAGAVWFAALALFALAPCLWTLRGRRGAARSGPSPLDAFLPRPDVLEQHATLVDAPADVVFAAACAFEFESVPVIRCIVRLRERLLGSASAKQPPRPRRPFVDEALAMGWGVLASAPGRLLAAGAACQPWLADVRFEPVPAAEFVACAAPGRVLIAWTIEVEPVTATSARLATETRAAATDAAARGRFRRYWRWARFGMVAIRWLMLRAIRRRAEAEWRARAPAQRAGR